MLRIVGIQRSERVSEEFILLQNQCSMRLKLKGHVLMTENRVVAEDEGFVHIFDQHELIHSGAFVLLRSGYGDSRWGRTKEGSLVYTVFLGKREFHWEKTNEKLHIANVQHTYEERVFRDRDSWPSAEPELETASSLSR